MKIRKFNLFAAVLCFVVGVGAVYTDCPNWAVVDFALSTINTAMIFL